MNKCPGNKRHLARALGRAVRLANFVRILELEVARPQPQPISGPAGQKTTQCRRPGSKFYIYFYYYYCCCCCCCYYYFCNETFGDLKWDDLDRNDDMLKIMADVIAYLACALKAHSLSLLVVVSGGCQKRGGRGGLWPDKPSEFVT